MPTGTPFLRIAKVYILFFLFLHSIACFSISSWETLAPGLSYQDLVTPHVTPWSHIHVFRIDPHHYHFQIATSTELQSKQKLIQPIAEQHHALIAMNGGFFDTHDKSIGLRISDHETLSPLKKISWWGIFYLQNNHPAISNYKSFLNHSIKPSFAIQAGPRLLINGHIPHLKPGIAERTAIGITASNQIIFIITEHNPMSTAELASLLRSPSLECTQALNMDGGSSTQLYAKIGTFKQHVRGFSEISDAILITPQ